MWNNIEKSAIRLEGLSGYSFDDTVFYIQDKGSKKEGYLYIDKNDGKVYRCKTTNENESNILEYFSSFDMFNLNLCNMRVYKTWYANKYEATCDIPDAGLYILFYFHSGYQYQTIFAPFAISGDFEDTGWNDMYTIYKGERLDSNSQYSFHRHRKVQFNSALKQLKFVPEVGSDGSAASPDKPVINTHFIIIKINGIKEYSDILS